MASPPLTSTTDSTSTSIPFEFLYGPGSTSTFHHDLPNTLLRAASMGMTPAYRQLYFQTMGPIMKQHEAQCITSSQAHCAVCGTRATKSVLLTPMSYLHLKEQPKVSVMVTPVCEMVQCNAAGKTMVNELVSEVVGESAAGDGGGVLGQQQTPRNAHCPCGSRRKFKKCCGSSAAMDDVD